MAPRPSVLVGRPPPDAGRRPPHGGLRAGAVATLRLLARRRVVRGLILLELADLQLDVMHALLGVYLVDAAGVGAGAAALALGPWRR